jgi:hypothetical protein
VILRLRTSAVGLFKASRLDSTRKFVVYELGMIVQHALIVALLDATIENVKAKNIAKMANTSNATTEVAKSKQKG